MQSSYLLLAAVRNSCCALILQDFFKRLKHFLSQYQAGIGEKRQRRAGTKSLVRKNPDSLLNDFRSSVLSPLVSIKRKPAKHEFKPRINEIYLRTIIRRVLFVSSTHFCNVAQPEVPVNLYKSYHLQYW